MPATVTSTQTTDFLGRITKAAGAAPAILLLAREDERSPQALAARDLASYAATAPLPHATVDWEANSEAAQEVLSAVRVAIAPRGADGLRGYWIDYGVAAAYEARENLNGHWPLDAFYEGAFLGGLMDARRDAYAWLSVFPEEIGTVYRIRSELEATPREDWLSPEDDQLDYNPKLSDPHEPVIRAYCAWLGRVAAATAAAHPK